MLDGKKVEIKTSEGFAPLPADKYTCQITDINLVTQLKYQSTEEEEVLNYRFQILDENPMPVVKGEENATTRGRYVWKRCRLAINNRSHLGKLAAAVEGRTLTKEEAENFDPESIIGKQVDLMIEQSPSKKDPEIIFNNILTFSKTIKKLEALPIEERKTQAIEKSTSPAVPTEAPDAEADNFVDNLEKEGDEKTPDELEADALELELKIAKAKIKAAKAKAEAKE